MSFEETLPKNDDDIEQLVLLARQRDDTYRGRLIAYKKSMDAFIGAIEDLVFNPSEETRRSMHDAAGGIITARAELDDALFDRIIGVRTIQQLAGLIWFDLEGRMNQMEQNVEKLTTSIPSLDRKLDQVLAHLTQRGVG